MKKMCYFSNILLLIWFFFDMIGLRIGNIILVEEAWKEDGIFLIIYVVVFGIFIWNHKYGKYPLAVWLFMWFITQFMSHWYYTIFGATEKKLTSYNDYFANTYSIIPASDNMLIPDLYHNILHILILVALINMIIFLLKDKRELPVTG